MISRSGNRLQLGGRCDAESLSGVELDRVDCNGVEAIDVSAIEQLDSIGVALIAELVARCQARNRQRPAFSGSPEGLREFCLAYRFSPDFSDFP